MGLTAAQRRLLLRVARDAIAAKVRGNEPVPSAGNFAAVPSGVFVTLHVRRTLRGCIGQVEGTNALVDAVRHVAVAAATEDPRFSPVSVDELAAIVVELSVLGPLESCAGPGDVEVGRHGLVVEKGSRRGLLLPQVAVEWGWDRHVFVVNACRKAGLEPDAWTTGASLFRFEAEVFSEDDEEPPGSPRP